MTSSTLLPGELPPPTIDPCADLLCDDTRLSRMAMEFARDLYPAAQILTSYGISEEDFNDRVLNSPPFMRYFAEHKEIWDSSTSTALRVTLKAGAVFEEWLKEANTLMHDRSQPMGPKVELAKELAELAGFKNVHAPQRDHTPADGRSTVIINLGHGREKIIIEKMISEPGDDAKIVDATPLPAQVIPPPHSPVPQSQQVQVNLPHPAVPGPAPAQNPPDYDPQMRFPGGAGALVRGR